MNNEQAPPVTTERGFFVAQKTKEEETMNTELPLQAPGLLFSTVSLILLAYTNRFLALTRLIRELLQGYGNTADERLLRQVMVLRKPIRLIRWIQFVFIGALGFSIVSIFLLLAELPFWATIVFGLSLLSLGLALVLCVREVYLSTFALNQSINDYLKSARKQANCHPSLREAVR